MVELSPEGELMRAPFSEKAIAVRSQRYFYCHNEEMLHVREEKKQSQKKKVSMKQNRLSRKTLRGLDWIYLTTPTKVNS